MFFDFPTNENTKLQHLIIAKFESVLISSNDLIFNSCSSKLKFVLTLQSQETILFSVLKSI